MPISRKSLANSARLFSCARCRKQVRLCSYCDRGNRYCGRTCSKIADRANRKRANQKYAQSAEGKASGRVRQRRLRKNNAKQASQKTVTDKGSRPNPHLLLSIQSNQQQSRLKDSCMFCGRLLSGFVRQHFLKRRGNRRKNDRQRTRNRDPSTVPC